MISPFVLETNRDMKSKLFIISKNNLTSQFWLSHLDPNNIEIHAWNNPKIAIANLTKYKPEAIVLDDYFNTGFDDHWMERVVSQFRAAGFIKRIFCVSPEFIHEKRNAVSSIPMARCYSFCNSFIKKLNTVLVYPDDDYEYKYWNFNKRKEQVSTNKNK